MYRNGYIFVTNAKNLDKIVVEGIFEDPTDLSRFKCDGSVCYDENSQYPMTGDITQAVITSILTNELGITGQDEKEINVQS